MRVSLMAAALALTCAVNAAAQSTGSISGWVTFGNPEPFVSAGGTKRVAVYTATAKPADAQLVRLVEIGSGNLNDYTISGLVPGTYYVRTVGDAFSIYADQWYPSMFVAVPGVRPQAVVVTAGATTTGINFVLFSYTGSITGTLTLATLPFTGEVTPPTVHVYNDDNVLVRSAQPTPGPGASPGAYGGPAAGGTFNWRVAGLITGRYYVRTSNPAQPTPNTGHVGPSAGWWVDELFDNHTCIAADCLPTRGTPISVSSGVDGAGGSTPSPVAIALDYGAVISGALPAPTFAGASGVDIYDSRGVHLPLRATIDAFSFGSSYFAGGLPAGTYFLKMRRDSSGKFPEALYKDMPCEGCAVTSGTPMTVGPGETKTGIDFIAPPKRAIRGTVRASGLTLAGVTVEAYGHNAALAGSVTTAADGTYTIDGLNPGAYYLRTVNAQGYVDELHDNVACPGCDPVAGSAVTVPAGADVTGIDFDLAPGTVVSGLVQSQFTSPASLTSLTGASVSIYTPSNVLAGRAVTDRTGRFTIALPAGTYYAISGAIPGHVRKLWMNGSCVSGICPFEGGTPIAVSGTPITNIDFALSQCSSPAIAPLTLATAAVGVPYRQTLGTTGSSLLPFAVSDGVLPPGLILQPPLGVITGTPTAAGRYTFTVDTDTCATTRTYTLDVPACTTSAPGAVSRAGGEPFLLPVTTTCASWTVSSNAPWISVEKIEPSAVLAVTSPYSGTTPRTGTVTIASTVVTVYQNGVSPQPPYGYLEAPAEGAVVAGSVAISGWALDDLAIQRIAIYRAPGAGEAAGEIYIGDATLVEGARPDVEAAFPQAPHNRRAGYGYLLLTNMLPDGGNGDFVLRVYADDIDGNRTLLGSRTIRAANAAATAPFGAIDTPAQGAAVSGRNYVNFGWALTPQPNLIPFDGSTIRVIVDGVDVGPVASYNLFRPDVASLFPDLANSGGPVGYRTIDTTALSEGLHSIAWVATDAAGQATGIGSRYFTVRNSAWTPSLKLGSRVTPPAVSRSEVIAADSSVPVPARIDGVELGRRAVSLEFLPLEAGGVRIAELRGQQRLELKLPPGDSACAARYEGYLSANGELRALPVGSSLDPAGVFYWQPGPAFRGSYRLLFVRASCTGGRERVPVTVSIR